MCRGGLWGLVGSCGLVLFPHYFAPRHLDLIVLELGGAEDPVVVILADDFKDIFMRDVGEEATEIVHQVPLPGRYLLMGWSQERNPLALLHLGFQMIRDSCLRSSISMLFGWVRSMAIGGTIGGTISIRSDISVRIVPPLSSSPLPILSSLIVWGMGNSVSLVVLSLLLVLSISPLSPSAALALLTLTFLLLKSRPTALLIRPALLLPVLLVWGVLPRGPSSILLAIVLIRTPVLLWAALLRILPTAFASLAPRTL